MPYEVQPGMAEIHRTASQDTPVSVPLSPSSHDLRMLPSVCCRICHLLDKHEAFISPCLCKGTLAYVHLSCLSRWLNQAGRSYCELCRFHYTTVETRRYGMWQSLRLWMGHPRNWPGVRSNLVIGGLLTLFTLGLVLISITGMPNFIKEGEKVGISKMWTIGVVSFFVAVVVLLYLATVILFAKDQFSPWFRWWCHCVNVHLLLQPPVQSELEGETCDANELSPEGI